ncbi:hypothetical protein B0H13DRAFT_1880199 [Mycena leptocephala]|nr:hypothetical protein B0H13DRAFT_1880199 [Mycena leptocephala]
MYVKDCRVRQIGCTEEPVTCTNNLNTAFPRPASSSPQQNRARAATVQHTEMGLLERWQEARGVGIGIAGDAALEEISRVHRFVSRRSWKGSSLSDACPVHSVAPEPSALLRERFELPLLCAPAGSTLIPSTMYSDYDEDDEELQQYLDEERRYHDEDQNDEQEHQNDPQPPQPENESEYNDGRGIRIVANFQPQLPLLAPGEKRRANARAPLINRTIYVHEKSEFAEVLDAVFVAVGWNEQTLGFKIVGEALRTNRFSPTQDGPQDGPGWCQSSRKQRKDGRRDLNTFDLDLICEVPRSFNGQHFETRDLDGGPSSGPVFFWKWIALIILNNFIT